MVYNYLDHTSDIYVHISSDTIEGLFEDAAKATYEVMIDPSSVRHTRSLAVEIEANDLEQLLYMWVDRLIYHFEADGFALSHAVVSSVKRSPREGVLVSAILHGDDYDPLVHDQKTGVKAMTYSLMRIFRDGSHWEAYFVLDI